MREGMITLVPLVRVSPRPINRRNSAGSRSIHGVCERAGSLLKLTFKALLRVSPDPNRITEIAAAAFVLLRLEHCRTI